jgi:enoyl-CoA hydratase/carnithine racemase
MASRKWCKAFNQRRSLRSSNIGDNLGLLSRSFSRGSSSPILLRSESDDKTITTLTLNRPAQYNALSSNLLDEIQSTLEELQQQDAVRVVIIKGAGEKAFCTGHDLNEMIGQDHQELRELFDKCSRVMTTLTQKLPQPVIAEVNGIATAAGCQLVASCDLAVASDTATFAVSGINVGLFCSTPAVALSRNLPRKHAMHMLLTGDFISAETAQQHGLVNQVVPAAELEQSTMQLARKIASKSPLSIRLGKDMFYKQLVLDDVEEAYAFAAERMTCNMDVSDAREAFMPF